MTGISSDLPIKDSEESVAFASKDQILGTLRD